MGLLAGRNPFPGNVRLAAMVTSVVFALPLIIVPLGVFLGFGSFDTGEIFPTARFYQVLQTRGVARPVNCIEAFARWKRPEGRADTKIRFYARGAGPRPTISAGVPLEGNLESGGKQV